MYKKRPLWQMISMYLVFGGLGYGFLYYFVFAKKPYIQQSNRSSYTTAQSQSTISGNDFAFSPSSLTLKTGQPAEITFKNMGKNPHNFAIPDLNVQSKTIQPGQEDTVSFTPTKKGVFEYVCTIPGHAERGMKGTLNIE